MLHSRLDEVQDAVDINAKLSQTIKSKEEKIESLEDGLVFNLIVQNFYLVKVLRRLVTNQ